MTAFYNEFDPHAARWLDGLIADHLIPAATVDTRSIKDLAADDLRPHTHVHLFAGIGGWPYALELAGWPNDRPVWTGSCPCQPFSSTGRHGGRADPRHLWPGMFRLVRECRPHVIFGEQVANAIGHGWLDGISADLEREGYAVGAAVLGAHSVGAPHVRQRLFWVAHLPAERRPGAEVRRLRHATVDGRRQEHPHDHRRDARGTAERRIQRPWHHCNVAACRDGKARRIEPGLQPLAHGLSGRVAVRRPGRSAEASSEHWINRSAVLRGFGNAIIPQVAAEFVTAFLEAELEMSVAQPAAKLIEVDSDFGRKFS